jgi:uncharacterized iron-regulated membrane protein
VFRRALFQVHLWAGVLLSLYLVTVSLSGASLLWRPELQRLVHPLLFAVDGGPASVDPATVIDSVQRAYPHLRLSGIDAPTTTRATWLAYVVDDGRYRTVLIDPHTGSVRGEMPDDSPIRTLQSLHFDLLAGAAGRRFNGAGAACLLVMALSGAILWWSGPAASALRRRMRVDFRRGWRQWSRELHAVAGIVACLFLVMWSVSGLYFAYPAWFRAGVGWITPLSPRQAFHSAVETSGAKPAGWNALLDAARSRHPGQPIARVVLPGDERGAVEVLFASAWPTPSGGTELQSVFIDQYSAQILPFSRRSNRGDRFMNWLSALHVGSFGGTGVRILWATLGLLPSLLAVTGVLMWRTRQRRRQPRRIAATAAS